MLCAGRLAGTGGTTRPAALGGLEGVGQDSQPEALFVATWPGVGVNMLLCPERLDVALVPEKLVSSEQFFRDQSWHLLGPLMWGLALSKPAFQIPEWE